MKLTISSVLILVTLTIIIVHGTQKLTAGVETDEDGEITANTHNPEEDSCFAETLPSDPDCVSLVQDDAIPNRTCKILKCTSESIKKCIKDKGRRESDLEKVNQKMQEHGCTFSIGNLISSSSTLMSALVVLISSLVYRFFIIS